MSTDPTPGPERRLQVKILLADDNEINRMLACRMLEAMGFASVDGVANGRDAIMAMERTAYDLVLMDVEMPILDGLEATKVVRDPSSPVRNHGVPIIAMTAHIMQEDRDRCTAAGMNDYVTKPLTRATLAEVIDRQLRPGK